MEKEVVLKCVAVTVRVTDWAFSINIIICATEIRCEGAVCIQLVKDRVQ
jgi:hypothetical protein